jgi:hypothetical protein
VSHIFCAAPSDAAALAADERQRAAAAKSAVEAAHAAHEAGNAPAMPANARVATFRAAVRAAHPESGAAARLP